MSRDAAENLRMERTLDTVPHRIIFLNARRLCKRQYQRSPNWVLAMELFGLGSTYAYAMCRRLGFDPDSRSTELVKPPSNLHPDVLAAHAQFGGDLEDMQRRYDGPSADHPNTPAGNLKQ